MTAFITESYALKTQRKIAQEMLKKGHSMFYIWTYLKAYERKFSELFDEDLIPIHKYEFMDVIPDNYAEGYAEGFTESFEKSLVEKIRKSNPYLINDAISDKSNLDQILESLILLSFRNVDQSSYTLRESKEVLDILVKTRAPLDDINAYIDLEDDTYRKSLTERLVFIFAKEIPDDIDIFELKFFNS